MYAYIIEQTKIIEDKLPFYGDLTPYGKSQITVLCGFAAHIRKLMVFGFNNPNSDTETMQTAVSEIKHSLVLIMWYGTGLATHGHIDIDDKDSPYSVATDLYEKFEEITAEDDWDSVSMSL